MFVHAGLKYQDVVPRNTVASANLKPDSRPAEIEKTSDPEQSLTLFINWVQHEAEENNVSIVRMFSVDVPIYDQFNEAVAYNCDLWWFEAEPEIIFAIDTSSGGAMDSIVGVAPLQQQ